TGKTFGALAEAGLDHVQISVQDSDAASADHIAGYDGAFARKRALAAEGVRHKLPLTVNAVVHRANIDGIGGMVDLALALGASRVEIGHVQYYGWALTKRGALTRGRGQVARAQRSGAGGRSGGPRQRWRNCARVTTAASSSTPWCPTTMPAIQSLASAAGAGARST